MKKVNIKIIPVFLLLAVWAAAFLPARAQGKGIVGGTGEKKEMVNVMKSGELQLKITGTDKKTGVYRLGTPVPVSREVYFKPKTKASNCFFLPPAGSKTFVYRDQFTGDVQRGGSCNVDILSYVPHGLTHIETSAHILAPDASSVYVKDIPAPNLSGPVFLIDLTHIEVKPGRSITWQDLEPEIKKIKMPVTMLAIKTKASRLPPENNFSGKDFLFLSPQAAQGIHDMEPRISCLFLDLPSIDRENDGGKLLAHRNFFGLPALGHKAVDSEKRALVELAYFAGLKEGYYYVFITPQRFQANAVSTGIMFFPLEPTGL